MQPGLIASMTGFGRQAGETDGLDWNWEAKSVNGRGLEVKFRLPAGFDGLETALRAAAGHTLRRGNVQAVLTVRRTARAELAIDRPLLDALLAESLALAARIENAPAPRGEFLLALPGVLRRDAVEEAPPTVAQNAAILAGFDQTIANLAAARLAEGARLAAVLAGLVDTVDTLVTEAAAEAATQPEAAATRLRAALAKLTADAGISEERLAQEVALLATRSDVREELDRLASHITAARTALAEGGPAGRQLDFLVQEFVREINTLCSKSASAPLTAIGLKLKYFIEQFREQVQNLE